MTRQLLVFQKELQEGSRKPEHAKQYEKYFHVHETPVRGSKVVAKQSAIIEAKKNYGFFALISNEVKDPIEALNTYRNKDLVYQLDGIECFGRPGRDLHVVEVTTSQQELFQKLGVMPPSSL
ncbi:hypothetical protein [Cohnella sp.]|uniref:hypothetical protein n=1 Tax=Cohnella sp. TaxID=1883426 RepID=UPI003565B149